MFSKEQQEWLDQVYILKCRTGGNTCMWFGRQLLKLPEDVMSYMEIITALKPDLLIECGTRFGGSALFYAHMFDLMGNGKVISIDICLQDDLPQHSRIEYVQGNTIDQEIIGIVKGKIGQGNKVMVVLDSDHSADHVYREMELYGSVVSNNQYMVIEDTSLCGHPYPEECGYSGGGPWAAVERYMVLYSDFKIDEARNSRFAMTGFPNGWLIKTI